MSLYSMGAEEKKMKRQRSIDERDTEKRGDLFLFITIHKLKQQTSEAPPRSASLCSLCVRFALLRDFFSNERGWTSQETVCVRDIFPSCHDARQDPIISKDRVPNVVLAYRKGSPCPEGHYFTSLAFHEIENSYMGHTHQNYFTRRWRPKIDVDR